MKTLLKVALVLMLLVTTAYSTTGFLSGSQTSGLTRICFYDTPTGTMTINIPASDPCPVTHEF